MVLIISLASILVCFMMRNTFVGEENNWWLGGFRLDVLQNLDGALRWLVDDNQTYACTPSMQTHLVLLLESCAEKIVGVQGLPGDDVRQFKRRVKKHSASARVHEEVTLGLMRALGGLLSKFQAEQDKVQITLRLICHCFYRFLLGLPGI